MVIALLIVPEEKIFISWQNVLKDSTQYSIIVCNLSMQTQVSISFFYRCCYMSLGLNEFS